VSQRQLCETSSTPSHSSAAHSCFRAAPARTLARCCVAAVYLGGRIPHVGRAPRPCPPRPHMAQALWKPRPPRVAPQTRARWVLAAPPAGDVARTPMRRPDPLAPMVASRWVRAAYLRPQPRPSRAPTRSTSLSSPPPVPLPPTPRAPTSSHFRRHPAPPKPSLASTRTDRVSPFLSLAESSPEQELQRPPPHTIAELPHRRLLRPD
jgi:hypothetical protein